MRNILYCRIQSDATSFPLPPLTTSQTVAMTKNAQRNDAIRRFINGAQKSEGAEDALIEMLLQTLAVTEPEHLIQEVINIYIYIYICTKHIQTTRLI